MKRKIGRLILFLLVAFLLLNTVFYLKLKAKGDRLLDTGISIETQQSLDLIGLLDSYGVRREVFRRRQRG